MCCFPNSPIDADMHPMKNNTTLAADAIRGIMWLKSFLSSKNIKMILVEKHQMKNTTSAADEIEGKKWVNPWDLEEKAPSFNHLGSFEDSLLDDDIPLSDSEQKEMMRAKMKQERFEKSLQDKANKRQFLVPRGYVKLVVEVEELVLKKEEYHQGRIQNGEDIWHDDVEDWKYPGVNSVYAIEHLSASAQVSFTDTTMSAERQTVSQGWYMDSGAMVHVCDSRAKFLTYSPASAGWHVVVANNAQADVTGTGTVVLILASGELLILNHVRHVPTINKCLISVSKLNEDGFGVNFEAQKVVIYQNRKFIGDGYNERGMFRLNINNGTAGTSTSGTISEDR